LAFASESIPWAHGQTIIAAIDAIADGWAELDRDGTFQLDG
jgi:hypothetical protein